MLKSVDKSQKMGPNRNVELLLSIFKKLGLGSARHFALKMQKARPKLELGSDTALPFGILVILVVSSDQ